MVLALVLFGGFYASAVAQIVTRTNVPPGEGTSTKGTFSIRFPIVFSDMEARAKANGACTFDENSASCCCIEIATGIYF
jgi:hypothetical protein